MVEHKTFRRQRDTNLKHIFPFPILYRLLCMMWFMHKFYLQPEKIYFHPHHIRINKKALCLSLYFISLFASFLKNRFYKMGGLNCL